MESIAELTPQMLYSCTRGFYAPSNMVLSVAGKITLAQAVDACKRNGLYRARAPHEVEWDIPAQTGPLPHKEAFFTMPVTKPCFGVAYREEPLAEGDLKRELLLDMLGDLVVGGLTKLYRRLYDEALVNPEFSGDFIAVRGACTVAFTGESDTPRQVVDLLQEEIERMRREGVDPEVFMLVKNQMYGELLGDVEHYDEEKDDWSTGYYGTGSRQQVTDDVFHKLETGEELTRDDFIKAELALQDAKLEAGIDLEKEKSPGLIGKYHDWKKNRVRHKVNKKKYLLLCLFLGWCGGHRYYEKRYALAAFYTLFFWSMVPFFLCVTDLLIALPMQADENGDILI